MSHSTDLALSRWPAIPPSRGEPVRSAASSIGSCRLPHRDDTRNRRRAIGLAALVSVGVHAVLLLAFNSRSAARPAPVVVPAEPLPTLLAFDLPPEEPAPEQPAVEASEADGQGPADTLGAASLPEPISTAVVANIAVVIRPSMPVAASIDTARWTVPTNQLRSTPAPSAQIFKLGELDRRPVLVSSVEPVFPAELSTSSVEGVVVVRFVVNAHGLIEAPEIVAAPHPLLGAAVTKALARWQFRAGLKNGRAVSTEMELPVRFNLAGT